MISKGHGAEPNNPSEIIPAGTRMTIPLTVMEQYQAEKGWGMPFNYLSYHYAIPMPSTLIKEEGTYYVPLSYTSKKDKKNKIIMMDLMNVQMDAKYNFTTLRDTYIIRVNKLKEVVFVAVNNKQLGDCLFVSAVSTNELNCYIHYYQ